MSVLIKDMEMPTSCAECYFLVERFTGNEFVNECDLQWHSVRCREEVDEECEMSTRSETCPLIEVPTPHGRLIDADAFDRHMKQTPRYFSMCCDLEEQPTIIEAEEGEEA